MRTVLSGGSLFLDADACCIRKNRLTKSEEITIAGIAALLMTLLASASEAGVVFSIQLKWEATASPSNADSLK